MKSFLTECIIKQRKSDFDNNNPLFYALNDKIIMVSLHRYAIIPLEEYEQLKELASKISELLSLPNASNNLQNRREKADEKDER